MSDVKDIPSAGDVKPDTPQGDKPETVPYGRFKEINDKLKELEAKEVRRGDDEKKAREDKMLQEKQYKELLEQRAKELEDSKAEQAKLAEIAKKFQEQQEKIRGEALNRIQDPELKKLAEKFSDPSDVLAFADKITPREAPYSGKGASPQKDADKFAKKPGESITDWSMRVDREISSRK